MSRHLAFALLLVALLVPLGTSATAGPGGLGGNATTGPGGSAGPSGPRTIDPPPRRQPAGQNGGARRLPAPEKPTQPAPVAEKGEPARKIEGGTRVPAAPGGDRDIRETTTVGADADGSSAQIAFMCRSPRLELLSSTPRVEGTPRAPASVHLARHSVAANIRDGVAVTELNQVYENDGDRIGEGTWSCQLPRGAAVTGFSIYMNGVEHAGRFMLRSEARRIYDEIVRRRRDPGLVELDRNGTVRVAIFPIPARGEMRIRMTWACVLPETGSASHYILPLSDVATGGPPLEGLCVDVDLQTSLPLRRVFTPGLPLEKDPLPATNRWRGSLTRRNYRPNADVELAWLVRARRPGLAVQVETSGDGTRTFFATIQAGPDPLTDISLDFGRVEVSDVFPDRSRTIAPYARRYIFGRLGEGEATELRLRGTADGESVSLAAVPQMREGSDLGALWAARKIERMNGASGRAREELVEFAGRFGVLTPYNAILAEE